ncbi:hypothetical protein KC19_1G249700 [Ceratodon purpureus]|uniref:Uncharacterized protein n=1 Tax=Ceratodon purpureus TaxID=3225 RepID=A0A8T0JA68_CERPU|nr:hypothetical protein KC19_1G249700 [Ceratodon purpureus]
MASALSMASLSVEVQLAKAAIRGRILRDSEARGESTGTIGYGHQLSRMHAFRTPSLRSSSSQTRPCVSARALTPAQEWVGLPHWRTKPMNELRVWGKRDVPTSARNEWEDIAAVATTDLNAHYKLQLHQEKLHSLEERIVKLKLEREIASLAEWGAIVLNTADPVEKAVLTHQAYRLWCRGDLPLGVAYAPDSPARPAKPELVHPRKIPPVGTILPPSAHALHNLAHIELNAIDLAWDTIVRFSSASGELNPQFFTDFAHVADDESRHCLWCLQRVAELGYSYGDMPAHNLLMIDCQKSSGSVMERLAIIPMIQEARGLDAGPRLFERLVGNGDTRSASMTKRIAEEEVGHVAVGVAWFVDVCKRLGVDPADRFQGLMIEGDLELRGPFNHPARLLAGLPRDWYDSSYDPASPDAEDSSDSHDESAYSTVVRRSSVQAVTDLKVGPSNDGHENGVLKTSSRLSEVYDRLATVVAMEQDNADA